MLDDITLDELMRLWPATIAVVLKHRMLCVGCPIGIFHRISDACRAHQVEESAFRRDIEEAIRASPAPANRSGDFPRSTSGHADR